MVSNLAKALNQRGKAMSYEEWKLRKDTKASLKSKLYKEA